MGRRSVPRPAFWLFLLTLGCQPAMHYEADRPLAPTNPGPPKAEDHDLLAWSDDLWEPAAPDVPIRFVTEKDGEAWSRLPKFWNAPLTEGEKELAGAAFALFPGTAAPPLLAVPDAVWVKVPADLDDPRPFLPPDPDDALTLRKWRLGRRLFYDRSWLTDAGDQSCASCHDPRAGFADDARRHGDFNTPSLVNCVYNRRQFWDGRVEWLEEVVQRTAADEDAPADPGQPFRHVWGGVARRLRQNPDYRERFVVAFGSEPTGDEVGKALAAYLRTLLAADSVYDRAVALAGKPESLTADHYEKALGEADLKGLGLDPAKKSDAAKTIYRGYRLFFDLDRPGAGCAACHGVGAFTDGDFHNLGVDFTWADHPEKGKEPGRFASLPLGRKDPALIGAYKTPTLRGLPRTGPYFHDGSAATLEEAVQFHLEGGRASIYRAPQLLERPLPPEDAAALVLFLRALEGGGVDPAVGPE